MPSGGSDTVKPALVDVDLFDHSCLNAQPKLPEQVGETLAVNQVDRRRTVAGALGGGAKTGAGSSRFCQR